MAIRPKLTLEDYGGDQKKLDAGNAALEAAWARANPAGTTMAGAVRPDITPQDTGGMADWGEHARVINGAFDRDNRAGTAEQVASAMAAGKMTDKEAQSNYGVMAAQKMDALSSMGDFSYDFNKDPLFKMLSDSYMQQARQAAANAASGAAQRTGGYGNSYGAAAAGQQYNTALGNLYDQVPELQEAAYQRYLNQRSDLYKQAGYYGDLENAAYGRTQDALAQENYINERDYARGQDDYNKRLAEAQYAASLGQYQPAEQLLGVDLSQARSDDDLNRAMQVLTAFGDDRQSAIPVIQAMFAGGQQSAGSAAGNGTAQAADPVAAAQDGNGNFDPSVSAGTLQVGNNNVILPPQKGRYGTYSYYIYNGKLCYEFTDANGQTTRQQYVGPLVTSDGKLINQEGYGSEALNPVYSQKLIASAKTAAGGALPGVTGNPVIDALLQSVTQNAYRGTDEALDGNYLTGDDLYNYRAFSALEDLEPANTAAGGGSTGRSGSGGSGSSRTGASGGYSGGSGNSGNSGKAGTGSTTAETPRVTQTMQEANVSTELWDQLRKKYMGN